MVKFRLSQSTARRLADFLKAESTGAARSEHWQHFASLSRISVNLGRNEAVFQAGAGFDSSYETNFRKPTLYELAIHFWLNIRNLNPDKLFFDAFTKLWPPPSKVDVWAAGSILQYPLTAHKFLAAHYANLILPELPETKNTSYVEIGPGSGYLAALTHRYRPGRQILIDLPEILPYSFLLLHRLFPGTPYVLPNELEGNPFLLPDEGFVFMTADQAARLPDHCMDIGVNTASFGEMLPDLVAGYFNLLRRIIRPGGLFFTCNRVEKWMEDASATTSPNSETRSGHWMRFEDYPWNPLDHDVFYGRSRFHDLVQPENPLMQRLCHLAPLNTTAGVTF